AEAVSGIIGQASALESEFVRATPDYGAASDFLRQSRDAELAALGMPPQQRLASIQAEAVQLAALALQANRNPAELVYSLARSRGYAPRAAAAAEAAQAAR